MGPSDGGFERIVRAGLKFCVVLTKQCVYGLQVCSITIVEFNIIIMECVIHGIIMIAMECDYS